MTDRIMDVIDEAYAAIQAHRAMGVGDGSIELFMNQRFGTRLMDAVLAHVLWEPLSDEFREEVLALRSRTAEFLREYRQGVTKVWPPELGPPSPPMGRR